MCLEHGIAVCVLRATDICDVAHHAADQVVPSRHSRPLASNLQMPICTALSRLTSGTSHEDVVAQQPTSRCARMPCSAASAATAAVCALCRPPHVTCSPAAEPGESNAVRLQMASVRSISVVLPPSLISLQRLSRYRVTSSATARQTSASCCPQ